MPRAPRLDIPHLLHHVIVRGIERRDIFLDDEDRIRFLERLAKLLSETSTRCFAWLLMSNHFHLLLMPTVQPLATLMRRLLTGYAVVYNRKYSRSGHVFQNRYKSIVCEEESYFLELVRYIHLNPLRAGIVSTLDELDRYHWSGHSVLMGNRKFDPQDTAEVILRFGTTPRAARKSYRNFVTDGASEGRREELIGGGLLRSQGGGVKGSEIESFDERILGSGDFVEGVRQRALQEKGIVVKIPLDELVRRVCEHLDIEQQALLRPSKARAVAEARAVVCYLAVCELGYKGTEAGRLLRLGPTGVTLAVRRGESVVRNRGELLALLGGVLEK
ncbi:transposase [Geobacter sp.]|uniref:transposase n=1 Tax=Geobacter sp. TaxID=46610 RepID=UPI002624D06F|nr:transposase [Geobacter sp.]